jgi:hypothetical protein
MRRRTSRLLLSLAALVIIVAAVGLAIFLRKRAAPEPARLLPDADAFVFVNLKPLRTAGLIGQNPPPITDPAYAQFVEQTGFQFERDLDEAAFAIHLPEPIVQAANISQNERYPRFSEIFEGHFDNTKVANYFRKVAANVESYRDIEIFSIPLEGRTVRVALLGVGTAAVSNTDGPSVIHGMIDKYKEIALPFGGPPLVRDYYHYVPLASLAWSIGRMPASGPGDQGNIQLPGGITAQLFLPQGTVVVTSVRYTGSVHIKAEAFTQSEQQASQIAEKANAFLSIFRTLDQTEQMRGPDADVKAFFESLKVEQEKDRAVLSAVVPQGFIKKMLQEPPIGEAPLVQGNEQKPEPPESAPQKHTSRKERRSKTTTAK